MTKTKANLLLLLAALIYGSYFVVLKLVSDLGAGPAFIMFSRGILFLAAAAVFLGKEITGFTRKELLLGSVVGFLNFLGFFFQALGSKYSAPANNAFLTCLNTVFVPFFAWLIYKKKPSKKCFVSLPAALLGMAILTNIFTVSFRIGIGDSFSIAGAVVFGLVIVLLGNIDMNYKKMLFLLAAWQAAGGFVLFGAQDGFALPPFNLSHVLLWLLYIGFICAFLASAIQVFAQKYTSETSTVMILSIESIFACVISIASGFDRFTWPLLFGGLLIVGAVLFLIADFTPRTSSPNIHRSL
ncbi:MAG: DMT family transporter [Firmicutes bacterium]|nr:DMT family transporter [Bacillota bacterium]